jgi:hypothetical protein
MKIEILEILHKFASEVCFLYKAILVFRSRQGTSLMEALGHDFDCFEHHPRANRAARGRLEKKSEGY